MRQLSSKFSSHCILSSFYAGEFDLDDVVTSTGDDGIDAVAVVIDEMVTTSAEDAAAPFQTARRNHDVDFVFIQAKRSEGFDLGEFLKFKEGILRFVNQTPYAATDEVLVEARATFELVVREVPKLRNGRPTLTARFVTTDSTKTRCARNCAPRLRRTTDRTRTVSQYRCKVRRSRRTH